MESFKTLVVGMAGGSASGKTTFTRQLVEAFEGSELNVELFNLDKYFYRGKDGGPTFVSPSTGEVMPNNNHPNSADNARLVADMDARCRDTDAPDVLIIEGLMTLHLEEIRSRLDLRLFMELDADVRAIRRMWRDMAGGRGNTDAKFIGTYYLECARVGHALYVEPSRVHADIILRGDADFQRTVPLIMTVIRDCVAKKRKGNGS